VSEERQCICVWLLFICHTDPLHAHQAGSHRSNAQWQLQPLTGHTVYSASCPPVSGGNLTQKNDEIRTRIEIVAAQCTHLQTNSAGGQRALRARSSGTMRTKTGSCWSQRTQLPECQLQNCWLLRAKSVHDTHMISISNMVIWARRHGSSSPTPVASRRAISRYCVVSSDVGFAQSIGSRQTAHLGSRFLHAGQQGSRSDGC
jgi:hypothetical protein